MLSDQIHNQTDKIVELEKTLDSKKTDLKNTENMLQIEMMNRSSLETTKLELLSEVSGLKLRQVRSWKDTDYYRGYTDDHRAGERGAKATATEDAPAGWRFL